MNTGIVITLIICSTILLVTIVALLFAMWVINKGVSMQENKR